jgi:hypothetical protein
MGASSFQFSWFDKFDKEVPLFDSLSLTRKGEGSNVKAPGSARYSLACLFLTFLLNCMAAPITHFIPFEMGHVLGMRCGLVFVATLWRRAFIAVFGVITVIHVATEVIVAMKPRTGTDEDTTGKPFRTVVAGWSTTIRRGIIVPIRTCRGYSDVNADLSLYVGSGHREADCSDNG